MSEQNTTYLYPGGTIKLVKAGNAVIDGQQIAWGNSIQVQSPMSKFPAKLSAQAVLKLAELVAEADPDFLEHLSLCK